MAVEALRGVLGDAEARAYALVVLVFLAGVTLQFLVRSRGGWWDDDRLHGSTRQTPLSRHGSHAHNWQGCILYHNWWPLLTAFAYVLVPMPYLFFAEADPSGRWVDASKFLTGAAVVGTVAVPAVLYTAQKITLGALITEVIAVLLMVGSLVAYDRLSEETNAGGFYSAL